MAERTGDITRLAAKNYEDAKELVGRLFEVARPDAVFGEPRRSGEHTVFTASEATVSMGFGFGFGAGEGPVQGMGGPGSGAQPGGGVEGATSAQPEAMRAGEGGGESGMAEGVGGGGGGGFAASRAVAVVSVGPNGVEVQPIVDVTKIGLAFFTMIGSFVFMLTKMRKVANQ